MFSDSYLISSESFLKILINFTSTVLGITFLALPSNLKNQNKFTFPRLAIKSFQSLVTVFWFPFFNIAFKTFETLYFFYFFQNNMLYFRSKNLDEFRPYLLVLLKKWHFWSNHKKKFCHLFIQFVVSARVGD